MMRNIVITTFLLFTSVQADFIRNDDLEVVNDTTTCLIWQDDNNSRILIKTWEDAIDYCDNMELKGYSDWRLPNFNELYSISDSNKINPAIKEVFVNTNSIGSYWSSTTSTNVTGTTAWDVDFMNGSSGLREKDENSSIRCVRGGE